MKQVLKASESRAENTRAKVFFEGMPCLNSKCFVTTQRNELEIQKTLRIK